VTRREREVRSTPVASDNTMKPFSTVNGTRASELIVDQIRDAFFKGMKAGDWLGTEGELAERFGVSRLTMRDAVRTLETYGMVEVKVGAGGGLRIAQVEPRHFVEALAVQLHLLDANLDDLVAVVAMLEPHAARLSATHRSQEQLDRLRNALERHVNPEEDPVAYHLAAADFHAIIAESAGNDALFVTLRALRINEEHLLEPHALPAGAHTILWTHQGIFEAIESGEADLAHRLMDAHSAHLVGSVSSRKFTVREVD
jgi:GntR family transcriptional repressor for pyruvate dehydrogenase complex